MTEPWITVLSSAAIVLLADLLATTLRRRARRTSPSAEPPLTEKGSEGAQDGEVARDCR